MQHFVYKHNMVKITLTQNRGRYFIRSFSVFAIPNQSVYSGSVNRSQNIYT